MSNWRFTPSIPGLWRTKQRVVVLIHVGEKKLKVSQVWGGGSRNLGQSPKFGTFFDNFPKGICKKKCPHRGEGGFQPGPPMSKLQI